MSLKIGAEVQNNETDGLTFRDRLSGLSVQIIKAIRPSLAFINQS